jgi:Fe-S oxidoreductase
MLPLKWILQATSSSTLKTKLSFLKEALPKVGRVSEIKRCMLCPNMCVHLCPVFDVERRLTVSPSIKSRLAYFSSVSIGDAIWRCVPCNACREACPMGISVNESLIEERGKICELDEEPESVKRAFISHESLVKKLEREFDDKLVRDGRLIYFPGCKALEVPEIVRASLKILDHLKIDFGFERVVCCGAYLKELGYLPEFKEHRQRLAEILGNYEGIISNCPHCVKVFVEEYDLKAVHVSRLLSGIKPRDRVEISAVYHDPCILSRDIGILDEPRKILSAIGVKLKEAGYSGKRTYCCGFGGIYAYIDAEHAARIAEERRRQLLEKSDIILTSCPRCREALNARDITEVVAQLL